MFTPAPFVTANTWFIFFSVRFCGIQYVGSTVLKNAGVGGTPNQNYFYQHILRFISEGHKGSIHDCEIILIGKMNQSDTTRREFF